MANTKLKLPRMHAAQKLCVASTRRFNILVAGEGAGKTTLGVEMLLAGPRGVLMQPAGKGPKYVPPPVCWMSPTEETLNEVRRHVVSLLGDLVKRRHSSRRYELVSGAFIDFYAFEDQYDVMDQYDLVIVDHAREVEGFLDLWEDKVRPMLQQHKGHAWVLSDAYGKKNDFYRLWRMSERDPDWGRFHFNSFANPHLTADKQAEARAVTGPEFQQRFEAEFLDVAIELTAEQRILLPGETFLEYCERLEETGLKVDGIPFTLSDRPAMRFLYEMIPCTREEAFNRIDVIMKCTQVGFTVMEMLAMIYLALRFSPAKVGMFMPSTMTAGGKSKGRFMPIVRMIPDVYALMVDEAAGGKGRRRSNEGNVLVREMGQSKFHFLWTSGKTATESNPMDVLSFDEVQEMKIADMEKTMERLSASKLRYTLMGSTANWPDSDIHWWYKQGTQHQFHTRCPCCDELQVLDEHFPECIGYDPDHPKEDPRAPAGAVGEYRYRCFSCQGWIDDPQQGEWIAKVPDAAIRSVHFPQFLSPTISARDIITAYHSADDMKNFWNRKLGKPYTDPSQVPVNLEMLNECAKEGMAAGLVWKRNARNTFMGLDQMGSFIVAVIKERMPDGRQAMVHLEYIFIKPTKENPDASPWDRCDELMAGFGVQCCVVETLPNYDSAKSFARRHDGKVFLAGYGNMDGDMLAWGDAPALNVSERRTDEELRDRFTVRLDQYKCMQVSMARFQKRMCLFPDPDGLVQEVLVKGNWELQAVCKEQAFFHFTRTALIAEKDEEEKKFKRRVVKVGIDPHTSYANMLCDVAWARAHGTSMFILPDDEGKVGNVQVNETVQALPGMQQALLVASTALADTCGLCQNRNESGICSENFMRVKESTPGCIAFLAVAS